MTKKKNTRKKHQRFDSLSTPSRFSNWWIWILIFLIAIQLVSSADLLRHDSKYENANMTASSRARFRRDTTKLENAVQSLAHLARVANGIALEIGLVDGSIQPGEAVSELLLMGDLKLDDIINLNHDSIDNVLDALNQKPKTSEEIEKLEQRLISLEDVREISSNLQNLKEIPGKKEFEASFQAVEDMVAHKATIDEFKLWLNELVAAFVTLEIMVKEGFTEEKREHAKHYLKTVSLTAKKLAAFQTAFDPVKKLIEEAKKMSENSKFIHFLVTENKFRTSEKVDYKSVTPSLLESFKKVHEDSQAASSVQKEFESIEKLVQTRSPLHRQTFQHTAGFPRGSDDLKMLNQSIDDPSIINHISNSDTVKTNLKEALGVFNGLEKEIDDISMDWKILEDEYKRVDEVVSTVVNLGKLPDVSQSISGTLDALVECDKGGYPTSKLDANFAPLVQKLRNKVSMLGRFGYMGSFSNLDSLEKVFDTYRLAIDEETQVITNAFNLLKTDKNLKIYANKVNKLQTDLDDFLIFLDEPTTGINLTDVTQHLTNIDEQEYRTFLKCVDDIPKGGFHVRDLAKFIQHSRKISVTDEVKDAISRITQSRRNLTNAQSEARKIKGNAKLTLKVDVIKASFGQENYEDVSRKLGMGVQGLAAILKARSVWIGDLLNLSGRIQEAAKSNGLSPEHRKSLQQLQTVKQVKDSIYTFIDTSEGLQAFRRKRSIGFQSFQEIFKEAANVQGAKINVKSLREAMEVLHGGVTAVDVMNALEKLGTLDLDFAKFKMRNAVSALIAMDKFFKKYSEYLSGSIKVPGPGNSLATTTYPSRDDQMASMNKVEVTTKENGLVLGLFFGYFVFVLILSISVGIWCGKRKSKANTSASKISKIAPPKAPRDGREEPRSRDDTQEIAPTKRAYGLHASFFIQERKSREWIKDETSDKPADDKRKDRSQMTCSHGSITQVHGFNTKSINDWGFGDGFGYIGSLIGEGQRDKQLSMVFENEMVAVLSDKEKKIAKCYKVQSFSETDLFTLFDVAVTDDAIKQAKEVKIMESVGWPDDWEKRQSANNEEACKGIKRRSGDEKSEHLPAKNFMTTKTQQSSDFELHFPQKCGGVE